MAGEMGDGDFDAAFVAERNQPVGLFECGGERFFAEDVTAVAGGEFKLFETAFRDAGAEDDRVRLLPFDHLAVIPVAAFRPGLRHPPVDVVVVRIGKRDGFDAGQPLEGEMGAVAAAPGNGGIVNDADFPETIHGGFLYFRMEARYSSMAVLTGQTVSFGQREISFLSPS